MTRISTKLALCISPLAFTIAAPAAAHPVPHVPTTEAAESAEAPSGPALWKVADEDTTIYLFGTVHAMRPNVQWMSDDLRAVLAEADEIVTEVDMTTMETAAAEQMPKAMLAMVNSSSPYGKSIASATSNSICSLCSAAFWGACSIISLQKSVPST